MTILDYLNSLPLEISKLGILKFLSFLQSQFDQTTIYLNKNLRLVALQDGAIQLARTKASSLFYCIDTIVSIMGTLILLSIPIFVAVVMYFSNICVESIEVEAILLLAFYFLFAFYFVLEAIQSFYKTNFLFVWMTNI
jgi:hypothetical protein